MNRQLFKQISWQPGFFVQLTNGKTYKIVRGLGETGKKNFIILYSKEYDKAFFATCRLIAKPLQLKNEKVSNKEMKKCKEAKLEFYEKFENKQNSPNQK